MRSLPRMEAQPPPNLVSRIYYIPHSKRIYARPPGTHPKTLRDPIGVIIFIGNAGGISRVAVVVVGINGDPIVGVIAQGVIGDACYR